MSAIQSLYTDNGWGPLPRHALYKKLVRGWSNLVGPVDAVTPKVAFTEQQLHSFYLLLHANHTFTNARDWLMYCLSFYALLRVSEVHRLTWGDILIGPNFVGITVPYSKTSLTPVTIKLFVRGDWACPKLAILSYQRALSAALNTTFWCKSSYPVFVSDPRDPDSAVTVEQSQRALKAMILRSLAPSSSPATSTTHPPSAYAWHSFRRGGTTALINAGVPDSIVQSHGRWRSDCYLRYYDTVNVHTLLPTQMLQLNCSPALAAATMKATATATGRAKQQPPAW